MKCQVPMWCMGCPAGSCGKDAYGPQIRAGLYDYELERLPYCYGPCCPDHGGPAAPILDHMEQLREAHALFGSNRKLEPPAPRFRVYKDGNMWCALAGKNLQEGTAAFADTPDMAAARLWARNHIVSTYPCPYYPAQPTDAALEEQHDTHAR